MQKEVEELKELAKTFRKAADIVDKFQHVDDFPLHAPPGVPSVLEFHHVQDIAHFIAPVILAQLRMQREDRDMHEVR